MICAAKLIHRITLEQPTQVRDSTGGSKDTWTSFATVWAAVEPIQGREYFAAEQVKADVTHRVRLRYLAGATPQMQVKFGGRIFRIEAVINVGERGRELQLMCVEVVP